MAGWGKENTSNEFLLEIAKGNVPGHVGVFPIGVKKNIIQTEETLWDSDGDFTWPTGDESWEILSDNVNDNSSGTGARTALVTGLDSDFLTQIEEVSLNGTTPVVLARTDWNRIQTVVIVLSGSAQTNLGNITLRVTGGGLVRSVCLPGNASTQNGFFTVPADKWRFIASLPLLSPKGEDMIVNTLAMVFGTNTWFAFAAAPIYQSGFYFEQKTFTGLPPKTDFEIRAKSTNAGITGTVGVELVEIDKGMVNR